MDKPGKLLKPLDLLEQFLAIYRFECEARLTGWLHLPRLGKPSLR
jgi:hypothetical protein